MSPKYAVHISIFVAIIFLVTSCTAQSERQEVKRNEGHDVSFTILQVNDVYKIEGLEGGTVGGIARLRTLRKQLEAEGQRVLVLHAGDLLFPSVMSKYLRAQPMVWMLNLLDGDPCAFDPDLIVVFGNHEFDDEDPGLLLGRVAQSDFQWVSSNVRYRTAKKSGGESFSQRLKNVHDVIVVPVDGIRIGIFGLTIDKKKQDYVIYDCDPKAAVRTAIDSLKKEGVSMIIALTHQELAQDMRLASEFPEIDLIIGGHEHFFTEKQVGHTWITKADADVRSAVVHHIMVSRNGSVHAKHEKIDINTNIVKDPLVEKEVELWTGEKLKKAYKEQKGLDIYAEIGKTQYLLEGVEPAVRSRETALGNFLADVIRNRMKTDIAFVNGGGIRINDNILPGPIRNYDMEGIFYSDTELVAFELTGEEIVDILRNSVSKVHLGDGRFLHVSGIRFTYHIGGTEENPVYGVEAKNVEVGSPTTDYVPIKPDKDKTYSVSSTDWLWKNGFEDGYPIFSKGDEKSSPERIDATPCIKFRAATEEAIAALCGRTVTTHKEERITAVKNN